MKSNSLPYLFGLLFIGAFFFLSFNEFELPKFLFGNTNKTYGVVNSITSKHLGRGVHVQVVDYKYKVKDSVYSDNYQVGIIKTPKRIKQVLEIEYEESSPEKNEVTGFYKEIPSSVSAELFPIEWTEIEMYRPTIIVHEIDSLKEMELKIQLGAEDFETSMDDSNWYFSQLIEKADSLNINLISTQKKYLRLVTKNKSVEIQKDTSLFIDTYIFFDGEAFIQTDLIDLIDRM